MNTQNYYKTLGISNKATEDEIKKAYRRLSLIHHPDRSGNSEDTTFQDINEAYETLGDSQKKRMYDLSLQNPFASGNNAMEIPIDMNNLFSMLFTQEFANDPDIHVFQGSFPIPSCRGRGEFQPPTLPEPIVKTMNITLNESYTGCCKPLEIERWVTNFNRKIRETETIYVDIPQGIGNNECIILKEKGNMISKSVVGDIKVMINIKIESPQMDREGLDFIYKHSITLKEALCGFSFSLKHVNGKEFKINNIKGNIIYPGFRKIIPEYGFIRNQHQGNLIIEFTIEFPKNLTDDQIQTIQNIF